MENFLKDDNSIDLEVTSHYGKVIDTDIRFFASDRGTSVLNFMITKNKMPLSISPNHAKAEIVLKTENYTVDTGAYISDKLDIVDAINGKLQYVIPDKFLQYTGNVQAQVYFTQNGSNNVIVQRQITFTIENDLISGFDGRSKLTYIRSIQDLKENIVEEVEDIKSALSESKGIVESIQSEFSKGIAQLEVKRDDAVELITVTEKEAEANLNNKIEETNNTANSIDNKISSYESRMSDNNLLTATTTSNWQKSKLTNDDGTIQKLYDVSINQYLLSARESKVVHIENATDAPYNEYDNEVPDPSNDGVFDDDENIGNITNSNQTQSGLLSIFITDYNVGRAFWQPDSSNAYYTSRKNNGIWSNFEKANNDGITKELIEKLNNETLNESKSYVNNKFNDIDFQKYSLVTNNGTSKLLDFAGRESLFYSIGSGFYYAINPPNLPNEVSIREGYLSVYSKDNLNILFEFTPINSNLTLKRRMNNGVLENDWFIPNRSKKVTLFEGSASGVGTNIVLSDDYNKYKFLIITGNYSGGIFNEIVQSDINNNITVSKTNILDEDGAGGGVYEMSIQREDFRRFKIVNDVYFDLVKHVGSGPNANEFTIKRIEGVE
ncbi:phage baseplate upper protein [Staphylococcus hominis]|uniref:phage baseplate upper protein n=1 Tax=Staphylococcus hominis TaxID=1290 RepID=UPI000D1FB213|nr:phage baseplate upper protein [Staphylococcus hominis]PTK22537.1 hypothetical protein BUZ52_04880 [Staphylococcus hominis]